MTDVGTPITPLVGQDLVPTLVEQATLVRQLRDPEISLHKATGTYLMFKRKRLSAESERGYASVLELLAKEHTDLKLADLEPPDGGLILEDFLARHWAHLAARTYNKSYSILCDFTKWHVARGTLKRDPMAMIEKAKTRPIHRRTFTDSEVIQILSANQEPRDQIALRLLLFFGIRKGALRRIQFEHFNVERRELTIFTKGGKIQTLEIVDETVWQLLRGLGEPSSHFLLPKRVTRRRTPPQKKALLAVHRAITEAQAQADIAAQDAHCAREIDALIESLQVTEARYILAADTAATQAQLDRTQPIGQHGAHIWWYRCLARAGVVAKGASAGRRMHLARHSAIQRVLDKTGNLRAAQELAGHSSVATTGDNYTEFTAAQLGKTMAEVLA